MSLLFLLFFLINDGYSQSMRFSSVFYIHSFTKYLMSIYYVSGTDLVAKNTGWNKIDNNPYPFKIYMLVR